VTIKPGAYPWGNHQNAWRPAHIHFSVFGHSFISRIVTQMYFPGDPLFAYDPILALVPADRRATLIARCGQGDLTIYRFDIHLQGDSETVFLRHLSSRCHKFMQTTAESSLKAQRIAGDNPVFIISLLCHARCCR
jgi:hypothetical protein